VLWMQSSGTLLISATQLNTAKMLILHIIESGYVIFKQTNKRSVYLGC